MKAGWKTVKLGEIAEIYNGNTISDEEKKRLIAHPNEGLAFIATKDVGFDGVINYENGINIPKAEAGEFKVARNNAVLVCAEGGSAGRKIGHVDRDVHFGNKLFALNASTAVHPRYLYHFCLTEEFRKKFKGMMAGLIGGVSIAKFKLIEIPLPPLAEQKRIVALLDEAFAGIDEAMAKAETKMETAGGLFNMLREELIQEPEADTPSYGFDEICKIDSVLVDPRENENANKLHVGGANIESKTGRLIALQTARQEGLKSGKFPFRKGMVLYSKIRPNLMKVARPDFDGLCSADMYPLAPNDGRVCRDYLYHLLLTERFTRFALLGSERAGMPKVNRDYLSRFTTRLPSIHAQKVSAEKLDSLDQSLRSLRELLTKKVCSLTELKSSLLTQAFAGELTP